MGFVVYSVKQKEAVGWYKLESSAKARVTRNNKQYVFETLQRGQSRGHIYAYCNWADFEQIAVQSKRKGYRNYHEF